MIAAFCVGKLLWFGIGAGSALLAVALFYVFMILWTAAHWDER